MKPEETWGEGTLIFAPILRKGIVHGLLNRLLPQLNIDLPLEVIKAHKRVPHLSKSQVNKETVQCVEEWLKDQPFEDDFHQSIGKLIKFLCNNKEKELMMVTIHENVFPGESPTTVCDILHRLQKADIVTYKLVGERRRRRWIVSDLCSNNYYLIV